MKTFRTADLRPGIHYWHYTDTCTLQEFVCLSNKVEDGYANASIKWLHNPELKEGESPIWDICTEWFATFYESKKDCILAQVNETVEEAKRNHELAMDQIEHLLTLI
jgi:hypothetical protein